MSDRKKARKDRTAILYAALDLDAMLAHPKKQGGSDRRTNASKALLGRSVREEVDAV